MTGRIYCTFIFFCDGDFWHGHNWAIRGLDSLDAELERYSPFWKEKIVGNINRDKENTQKLVADGWTVMRFWESDIKADIDNCVNATYDCYRRLMLASSSTHNADDRIGKQGSGI